MVVEMSFHLLLRAETPPTVGHRTAERTLALVRSRVLVQYGLLPEVFAALGTLIGLLACVYAQMLIKYGTLTERSVTVQTGEWFFVRVNAQVLGEMALLTKAFPALDARIRTRLNMHATVL